MTGSTHNVNTLHLPFGIYGILKVNLQSLWRRSQLESNFFTVVWLFMLLPWEYFAIMYCRKKTKGWGLGRRMRKERDTKCLVTLPHHRVMTSHVPIPDLYPRWVFHLFSSCLLISLVHHVNLLPFCPLSSPQLASVFCIERVLLVSLTSTYPLAQLHS